MSRDVNARPQKCWTEPEGYPSLGTGQTGGGVSSLCQPLPRMDIGTNKLGSRGTAGRRARARHHSPRRRC
eukprot:6038610-Alexandrium_andersonii.AAC.1